MIDFLRDHARTILIAMLLCALLLVRCSLSVAPAHAATINPPCGEYHAQPPLLVVLPDGTEIPASSLVYDLEALRIDVIGYDRIFCDGWEVRE